VIYLFLLNDLIIFVEIHGIYINQ